MPCCIDGTLTFSGPLRATVLDTALNRRLCRYRLYGRLMYSTALPLSALYCARLLGCCSLTISKIRQPFDRCDDTAARIYMGHMEFRSQSFGSWDCGKLLLLLVSGRQLRAVNRHYNSVCDKWRVSRRIQPIREIYRTCNILHVLPPFYLVQPTLSGLFPMPFLSSRIPQTGLTTIK